MHMTYMYKGNVVLENNCNRNYHFLEMLPRKSTLFPSYNNNHYPMLIAGNHPECIHRIITYIAAGSE